MSVTWCTHGLNQRKRYGTKQSDGLDICQRCMKPTLESWRAKEQEAASQPASTGDPAAVGQAKAARARGSRFLEIQLEIADSSRDVRFGEADSGHRIERDHSAILAAVEREGWRLEHVGYVFVPTGQSTRQKILGTGESVAVSGTTVGIYLFRAIEETGTPP